MCFKRCSFQVNWLFVMSYRAQWLKNTAMHFFTALHCQRKLLNIIFFSPLEILIQGFLQLRRSQIEGLSLYCLPSVSQLCHGVVDALCGRQPPRRSDYSSATCSPEEWLELLDSLKALFRLAVGSDSSDEEVANAMNSRIQWLFLNNNF